MPFGTMFLAAYVLMNPFPFLLRHLMMHSSWWVQLVHFALRVSDTVAVPLGSLH